MLYFLQLDFWFMLLLVLIIITVISFPLAFLCYILTLFSSDVLLLSIYHAHHSDDKTSVSAKAFHSFLLLFNVIHWCFLWACANVSLGFHFLFSGNFFMEFCCSQWPMISTFLVAGFTQTFSQFDDPHRYIWVLMCNFLEENFVFHHQSFWAHDVLSPDQMLFLFTHVFVLFLYCSLSSAVIPSAVICFI